MLITAMTPGPNEPTADQLQNILRLIVNDLKDLWENGKTYKVAGNHKIFGM